MEITASRSIWPILVYMDGPAAIRFLVEAFGFEETAVYAEDKDESLIVHAELRWPGGGGIIVGSAEAGEAAFRERPPGTASVYVVTDDPDALHARVVASGGEIARELRDEGYGSRGVHSARFRRKPVVVRHL